MSHSQMIKAQALIKQQRYDDAYVILQKLDNPQAKKWLAQIDKIQREQRQQELLGAQDASDGDDLNFMQGISEKPKRGSSTEFEFDAASQLSSDNYQAVRLISGAYLAFGYLFLGGGILLGLINIVIGMGSSSIYGGSQVASGFSLLIAGAIGGISMIAAGQLIRMMIEVVDNTRLQVKVLQKISSKLDN